MRPAAYQTYRLPPAQAEGDCSTSCYARTREVSRGRGRLATPDLGTPGLRVHPDPVPVLIAPMGSGASRSTRATSARTAPRTMTGLAQVKSMATGARPRDFGSESAQEVAKPPVARGRRRPSRRSTAREGLLEAPGLGRRADRVEHGERAAGGEGGVPLRHSRRSIPHAGARPVSAAAYEAGPPSKKDAPAESGGGLPDPPCVLPQLFQPRRRDLRSARVIGSVRGAGRARPPARAPRAG